MIVKDDLACESLSCGLLYICGLSGASLAMPDGVVGASMHVLVRDAVAWHRPEDHCDVIDARSSKVTIRISYPDAGILSVD